MGMPMSSMGGVEKTVAIGMPMPAPEVSQEDGKTVAMFYTEEGIDPVVGWLVCVGGKEKGQDYRVHSDNNFIGRSEKMDVCIKGDDTISRENQAILTYDSGEKVYYFSPGEGRSVVRLNGKAILQTVQLQPYDKVTIGKTEFIFIPLCGDVFSWEDYQEE